MPKWTVFTPEDLQSLAQQKLTLDQTSEMRCPCCNHTSMRVYIHDLSKTKTAEWLWCADCQKTVHHCIACPSDRYSYNDPLNDSRFEYAFSLSGSEWYEFLQKLHDNGTLPQIIRKK